jgi:hypothetical protein
MCAFQAEGTQEIRMSEEIHVEEHSSPIKTPKQLIIVVVLAFVVPITLIVMLAQLVISGMDSTATNPGMSEEAIAKRLKPVGEVVMMSKEEREAKAKAAPAKPETPAAPAAKPDMTAKAPAASPQEAKPDASKGKAVYDVPWRRRGGGAQSGRQGRVGFASQGRHGYALRERPQRQERNAPQGRQRITSRRRCESGGRLHGEPG